MSIVLIIVAMVLSMLMTARIQTASKGLIFSVWGIYIIAEGIGFGILFAAFQIQFGGAKGLGYLMLVFAAGGLAFLICALIGKRMSLKATIALGK
ncbi:hypothetical protein FACS1894166_05000 [Bacilli bacterium]|nr:hypothetical protein FACS1894166_05000 [Bacilli bacterium]